MDIGFIGLGIMGKPMVKNLLKAGYTVKVFDIIEENLSEAVSLGALPKTSPKEVADSADLIITMLPNSPHVKAAVLGIDGIIESIRSGSIFIDMSSINPIVSQEIAQELAKIGVSMLDAPVSGGEPKAIEGTLAIMVGGAEET